MPTLVQELRELVVAYARQETIDPLKSLGRFVAFGVAGSLALGIGIVLVLLGVLRFLQDETGDAFSGRGAWSALPYFLVAFSGLLVAFLAVRAARRSAP